MISVQGEAAGVTRRGVLASAAAVGVGTVAVGMVGACSDGSGEGGDRAGGGGAEPLIVARADVPVGGAAIVGQVIVSQPTAGEFRRSARSAPTSSA